MKHIVHKCIAFIKRPLGAILIVILLGIVFIFARNNKATALTATVERGSVIQNIAATGKTKAKSSAHLSFERSGQIAHIYAQVGDQVYAGKTLVELERSELVANLNDAKANVNIQKAKLAELKSGSSPEAIALKETAVTKAKNTLLVAEQNLSDKLQEAYTKADNAIRNHIDQFITNGSSNNPSLNFTVSSQVLENDIENGRVTIEKMLIGWNAYLKKTPAVHTVTDATKLSEQNLVQITQFLDMIALAVNALTPTSGMSQTTIDAYKSGVITARTDVNTAITNISTVFEKLKDAESGLIIATQELSIAITGGTAEELATQKAYIEQAEAKMQAVQAQIGKTTIRSPIAGIITKQDAEIGETVSAYENIVSVTGGDGFEIEAFIPEINIGKISVENPVHITLDAFPEEVFAGTVSFIDPAETIVNGVVNFKITIRFDIADERIKSGLTANLSIETARKDDVLFLPRFSVTKINGDAFVTRVTKEKTEKVPVILGLQGEGSKVEIQSGLSEGDAVLVEDIK